MSMDFIAGLRTQICFKTTYKLTSPQKASLKKQKSPICSCVSGISQVAMVSFDYCGDWLSDHKQNLPASICDVSVASVHVYGHNNLAVENLD